MEQIWDIVREFWGLLFGASGIFATFLYFRYERRKRGAEAKTAELDAEDKEDKMRDAKLIKAYETIEALQKIVDAEREKWAKLAIELSEMKYDLIREKEYRRLADRDKCTVEGCSDRCPPREEK